MRNGAFYSGEAFLNNVVKEGRGMLIKYDGSLYEGYWKADKPAFYGRNIYANGEYYEGGYLNGLYEGQGVKVYNDGKRYEGQWHEGVPPWRRKSPIC